MQTEAYGSADACIYDCIQCKDRGSLTDAWKACCLGKVGLHRCAFAWTVQGVIRTHEVHSDMSMVVHLASLLLKEGTAGPTCGVGGLLSSCRSLLCL